MRQLIKIKEYDAHGGPKKKERYKGDDYAATPTNAGRFVVHAIEKHVSNQRYFWFSGIPWGAGLRNINDVIYVDVKNNNHWVKLSQVVPQWLKSEHSERAIASKLKSRWYFLNILPDGSSGIMDGRDLPDKWLFSDFGHSSVKYFVDTNHDGIKDYGEKLMSDFIHTTPNDEATTAYNLHRMPTRRAMPINLQESHGCIHVKPADLDLMVGAGYLKKGVSIVVHSYNEKTAPATIKPDPYTRGQYEVHFFPGIFKIVIYKLM